MTHRVFSRNSASSRAIPVKKMIRNVLEDPVVPVWFGKTQKGMQAKEELTGWRLYFARQIWLKARFIAVAIAWCLLKLGLHKQIANRLLEPWMWITVICTATEFGNFFNQRCHPDAQPEIKRLADWMQVEYFTHTPTLLAVGEWHLPLIQESEWDQFMGMCQDSIESVKQISTARCARVSFLTHDGRRDVKEDLNLHHRLIVGSGTGHWCYDPDTEVLTSLGFKKWPHVTMNDYVAVFDQKTEEITFQHPQQLITKDFSGLLYYVNGQQLDLLVTPEHRMYVSSRGHKGWKPFAIESAKAVARSSRRYRIAGEYKTAVGLQLPIPPEFLGFFIGDGYAGPTEIEFNLKLSRKINYLKQVSDGLDLRNKVLSKWLRDNCYTEDKQKCLPVNFIDMTRTQVLKLFEGLKNSDGSVRRNTWVYDTTSKILADQIQALGHIHNIAVQMSRPRHQGEPNHKPCYRLNFSNRVEPEVSLTQKGRSNSYTDGWKPYSGKVYCASVSTGLMIVRRNNKVVISGNSPFEHSAQCMNEPVQSGNFTGWKQYRKEFINEHQRVFTPNLESLKGLS